MMMKNCKSFLFKALVAIQIANVMSATDVGIEDSSQCSGLVPFLRTDCVRQCPKTFTSGRCLELEGKWQCLCGESDNIYKLLNTKVANKIYSVCNSGIQNHEGCKKLCPKEFQHGSCAGLQGMWQCVCKQEKPAVAVYTVKEATIMEKVCNHDFQDNRGCSDLCPFGFNGYCEHREGFYTCFCGLQENRLRLFLYSIESAENLYGACNHKVKNDAKCKLICPHNFEIGRCDRENGIWGCRCSYLGYGHESYSMSDAKRSHKACYEEVHLDGCLDLCPIGFTGQCVDIAQGIRGCGCKVTPHELGWYTVKRAEEMNSFCNFENYQTPEAKRGCSELCPQIFAEGKCSDFGGYWECLCNSEIGVDAWITLRKAIAAARHKRTKKQSHRKAVPLPLRSMTL